MIKRQLRLIAPQQLLLMPRPGREERYLEIAAGDFPALNVWRDEEALVVQALVPGVAPEALDLTVDGQTLSIAGEIRAFPEATTLERRGGAFKRVVEAPFEIDPDAIGAQLNNGVLALRLRPLAAEQPRQIRVTNGGGES